MLTQMSRIRPFLGAADFELSRRFYRELGFREVVISDQMSAFNAESVWFYLQKYYVKDWVDNTMVFLEVTDLDLQHSAIVESRLADRYDNVRVSDIKDNDWGREFFMHDPSGNLWHIGKFSD
ncbi:MAG TPA: glyoxalase [Planctomycetaceae bacterium]|nr:glyoxalase [Planctomycetaceae bacterium]